MFFSKCLLFRPYQLFNFMCQEFTAENNSTLLDLMGNASLTVFHYL